MRYVKRNELCAYRCLRMTAIGQERTFAGPLFNHPVGAYQNRLGDLKA